MTQPPVHLWRERNFPLLSSGQASSRIGSQLTIWALPLAAVLVLHASPMQMGLLTAASIAPSVLAGLFAGVWVDRVGRQPLLIAADIARALLLPSIPLAAWFGRLTLPQFYAVAVAMSLCAILFDVAYGAFLPPIASRQHLLDAKGKLEARTALARTIGPGLAGVLVRLFSGPTAVLADALSFIVSFGSLSLIPVHELREALVREQRPSWLHEVGQSVRFVTAHALPRPLAVSAALFGLFDTMLAPCTRPISSANCAFPPRFWAGSLR